MQITAQPQKNETADSSAYDLDSERQYFSFMVREQEYAVDILRVVEIRGWTGTRQVPSLPTYMKGVIDLRGEVVPIIDLRERFGMPSLEYNHLTVVVILKVSGQTGNKTMGIIVDAVSDVYTINDHQLKPAPDFGGDIDMQYVTSLATVEEKMVVLLDVDELLGTQMPEHIEIRTDLLEAKLEEKDETVLLETSFAALAPRGKEIVSRFYDELFRRAPEVKPLFANTTIAEQEKKLLAALQLVVSNLRNPEQLTGALQALGVKHQGYGATAEHYDVVAQTMLKVLGEFAGNKWTHEIKSAWSNAFVTIKDTMLGAYNQKKPSHSEQAEKQTSEADLIEHNFAALAPKANDLVARFYQLLFERYPMVKPLFKDIDLITQQQKLVSALKLVVNNLRKPAKLERSLKELGKKHQNYGALEAHYDAVAKTMLDVLKEFSGNNWNGQLYTAWFNALQTIKEIMLSGYDEGLTHDQIKLLEDSFSALAPRADELVARFYGELFKRYPAVKPMFAGVNPNEQKKKLLAALKLVIHNLRNPAKLTTVLKELGQRHQNYGALATHYDAVANTLLDIMDDMAGKLWEDDVNEAWEVALKTIKEIMLSAYKK